MNRHIYRNIFAGLFAGILLIAGIGFVFTLTGSDSQAFSMVSFPAVSRTKSYSLHAHNSSLTGTPASKTELSDRISDLRTTPSLMSSPEYSSAGTNMLLNSGISSNSVSGFSAYSNVPQSAEINLSVKSASSRDGWAQNNMNNTPSVLGLNSANRKLMATNSLLAMAEPSFAASDIAASPTMQKVLPGTGGDATFEELAPVSDGTLFLLAIVFLYLIVRYRVDKQILKIF